MTTLNLKRIKSLTTPSGGYSVVQGGGTTDKYIISVLENSIKKKMSIYVKILDMIEHNYGISYNIKTENRDSIIIYTYNLVHTERVDSALMLLPYYNNKLKRENDSVWTIKTPIQWNVKNKKKK